MWGLSSWSKIVNSLQKGALAFPVVESHTELDRKAQYVYQRRCFYRASIE